jgi:hypothetical protein
MTDFTVEKKFYETNIINPTIKIFSLSDIHGDIQSFIISLRDCANVIRKKKPQKQDLDKKTLYNYEDFNNETYDANMEDILNLDLNKDEERYIPDLNYEWCGGNTHVVICGDMIDPYRNAQHAKFCIKEGNLECAYYPQIELKILIFINALNNQAKHTCGKIVKLFGNHELCNIITVPEKGYVKFTYSRDRTNEYYKGVSRVDIFKVGAYGFNLLVEGGCGTLIKINNTIFVHGDLVESYDIYDDLNQFINNPQERTQLAWNKKFSIHMVDHVSSLFRAKRSDDEDATKRITQKNNANDGPSKDFCNKLIDSFAQFKGDGNVIKEDVNDLKLVIGHCPQHYVSYMIPIGQNETYSEIIRFNNVMEVFGNKIYSGEPNFEITDNRTKIFGITMECLIPNTNLNRVYRVDIGSSRGLDGYNSLLINTIENENKYLYSKTPQILEINIDGSINIIKSKIRNTRIHQPRPAYEEHAKTIDELNIHTIPVQNHYLQKYLKYKNKYLQLKQNKK